MGYARKELNWFREDIDAKNAFTRGLGGWSDGETDPDW
jgi:hypothetical protein